MMPACSGDAGAATDDPDDMGISSVTSTPKPNAAASNTTKSGFRFTVKHSLPDFYRRFRGLAE